MGLVWGSEGVSGDLGGVQISGLSVYLGQPGIRVVRVSPSGYPDRPEYPDNLDAWMTQIPGQLGHPADPSTWQTRMPGHTRTTPTMRQRRLSKRRLIANCRVGPMGLMVPMGPTGPMGSMGPMGP